MSKTIRKILFWTHLIAGCIGGVIIFAMCVTGVLLTYERQMIAFGERSPFRVVSPSGSQNSLPIEDLLSTAGVNQTATITLRSAASEPVEANFGPKGTVYLDPYSGKVLGFPSKGPKEFFQKLRAWHRWLAWEGPWRAWGKAITGACTLAFLSLVLSGMYLWIPQVWSWRHVRPVVWFRGGLSGKARDFNWHNAIGLWSAVPLFFIIVSALPISYPWASQAIYTFTGTAMPKSENPTPAKGTPNAFGLSRMVEFAKTSQGWQSISFRYGPGDGPVAFTIDRGDGGQPQLRSTLTLDRNEAKLVKLEGFDDFNAGRKIRSYSRFLHTGESMGIVGQTVAGVASLGGAILVWTGMALAWRRFINWRKRSSTASKIEQEAVEPVAI